MLDLSGTLAKTILDKLSIHPEKLGVADPHQQLSRLSVSQKSRGLACFLHNQGVAASEPVLFCVPNSAIFILLHFGILLNGSVSVPLEYGITPINFNHILTATKPRLIILHESIVKRLTPELDPAITTPVLQINDLGQISNPFDSGVALTDMLSLSEKYKEPSTTTAESLATIMFTSGSTGKPKGVMLKHVNILSALKNIMEFCDYSPDDFEIITLPLSHNFGLGHAYCCLFAGGGLYTEGGMMRMKRVLNAMEEYRATGFPTTPAGVALIVDRYAEKFAEAGKSLRFMVVNSAPLPPGRTKELRKLMGHIDVMVYYGLTEASRSTFINLSEAGESLYTSVGKPMSDITIEIDAHTQEVLISGPTLTPGYWQEDELTSQTFINGKMHTGDMGKFDEQGNLFIIGRLKDQINVGGHKVDPNEVDAVLTKVPGIAQSVTFGIAQSDDTQQVISFLVLEPQAKISQASLNALCKEELEYYKVPEQYCVVKELPRNDNGKIIRHTLVSIYDDRAWQPINGQT